MTRPKWWVMVGLAVAVVVAAGGAFFVVRGGDDVPDGAAFVYGDRVVTVDELENRVDALRALYGITVPKDATERDTFWRSAAKSFALTLILDTAAESEDVTISDKQARDLLDKYVAQQFGNGGRDEFIAALGNVGTSEAEVLDEIRRQAIVLELRTKVVGSVSFTDAQVKAAFDTRKDELGTPELRRLQNVVVAEESEAKAAAARLAKGDSVKDVAADVSIDESTRESSGDLGLRAAAELEPSVAKAAFAVAKGGVYGPVKGSFGWNVGVVSEIQKPRKADFETIQGQFKQQLIAEESSRRWVDWLATAIRQADVRYADDYRPEHPDSAPDLEPSGGTP